MSGKVAAASGAGTSRGSGIRLRDVHPAPHADTLNVFCPISKLKQDGPVSEHLAFNPPELGIKLLCRQANRFWHTAPATATALSRECSIAQMPAVKSLWAWPGIGMFSMVQHPIRFLVQFRLLPIVPQLCHPFTCVTTTQR